MFGAIKSTGSEDHVFISARNECLDQKRITVGINMMATVVLPILEVSQKNPVSRVSSKIDVPRKEEKSNS